MSQLTALARVAVFLIGTASHASRANAQASAYPSAPRPLPEEEEIALARSAAPAEISAAADIYVLRADGPVKVRHGTNGCSCMVARDLHEGSRYPICFDREATRTVLHRELKELELRAKGLSEDDVQRAVAAAYDRGELKPPSQPAMAYMMSSQQVLFASPHADGRRVGAWSPHVMIYMPGATGEQFGLASTSKVTRSPPTRRSKSSDPWRPVPWKKYSLASSAAMKPKPRSEITFLTVPVATLTSTLPEQNCSHARSAQEGTTTRSTAPLRGGAQESSAGGESDLRGPTSRPRHVPGYRTRRSRGPTAAVSRLDRPRISEPSIDGHKSTPEPSD